MISVNELVVQLLDSVPKILDSFFTHLLRQVYTLIWNFLYANHGPSTHKSPRGFLLVKGVSLARLDISFWLGLIIRHFCHPFYKANRLTNEFQNDEKSLLSSDSTAKVDGLRNLETDACYFIFCFLFSWEHFSSFVTWQNKYAPLSTQHLPVLCVCRQLPLEWTLHCPFLVSFDLSLQILKTHKNDLCFLCTWWHSCLFCLCWAHLLLL